MVISHNLSAINTNRMLGINNKSLQKNTEKLSSGYKINRAADDAAGLSISEKMRRQIRGLRQSRDNIQDGISYCNVAEGALSEVHDMLARIKELSVQAANGTNTNEDRSYIDQEVQQIGSEIDRIFKTTTFNEQYIWPPELIPQVSGIADDYGMYRDATGQYYDGISYMGHRYSWADLGVDWDSTTHTFTSDKTYNIDSSILKDDPTTSVDNYNSAKGAAIFTLTTYKDQPVSTLEKAYSWSADTQGIRIDGVLTTGTDDSKEGNTTWAKIGLTPGANVLPGEYEFNYYGMNVSFEIAEETEWDEFLASINSPSLDIDWHSNTIGTTSNKPVANVASGVSKINITAADRDNIANSYQIYATNDQIYIQNSAGKNNQNASTNYWDTLSNIGPDGAGSYSIGSWGTDVNGNSTDKSDSIHKGNDNQGSSAISTYEDATYTYSTNFLSTNVGNLSFSFTIQDDQSKADILEDIGSIHYTVTSTTSPVDARANAQSTDKVYVAYSQSENISFYTQRDILDRSYNTNTESIATGKVIKEGSNYAILFTNGDHELKMTSTLANPESIYDGAKNAADTINHQIVTAYNKRVDAERRGSWATYTQSTTVSQWDDLKDLSYDVTRGDATVHTEILDDYLKNTFSGSSLNALRNADAYEELFGSAYTDALPNITTDAERDTLLNNLWNNIKSDSSALNSAIETLKSSSNISDAERSEILRNDLIIQSHKDYLYSTLKEYGDNTAGMTGYDKIDDLIQYTIDDRVKAYVACRDAKINEPISNPGPGIKGTYAYTFSNGS